MYCASVISAFSFLPPTKKQNRMQLFDHESGALTNKLPRIHNCGIVIHRSHVCTFMFLIIIRNTNPYSPRGIYDGICISILHSHFRTEAFEPVMTAAPVDSSLTRSQPTIERKLFPIKHLSALPPTRQHHRILV